MDLHGNHTSTCRAHSGATKAHDWLVSVLGPLLRTAGHTVRTQHGVPASAGQRRGDVEIRNYLRDQAGSRSLVFDLSITHQRYGSSSHPLQWALNSQNIDAPLHLAAQRKVNSYRQQYADNQNISFLPAILSTSTRMHGEFLRLLFYRPTGRPRRTSLPLACHRNATIRTRSVSSARHSTSRCGAKSDSRWPKRRRSGSTSMSRALGWKVWVAVGKGGRTNICVFMYVYVCMCVYTHTLSLSLSLTHIHTRKQY